MNAQWKTPVEMEISTAVAAVQNEQGMGLDQDRSGRFGADDLRRIVAALRGCDPKDVDATARECVEELGERCGFDVGPGSRTRLRKDEKQNVLDVLQGKEPSNSSDDDEDNDRIDIMFDDIPSDEATADAIEADCGVRPMRVRWETGFRQYVEARFDKDDYDTDPRDATDLEVIRSSGGHSCSSRAGERTVTHYRTVCFDLGDMLTAVEGDG